MHRTRSDQWHSSAFVFFPISTDRVYPVPFNPAIFFLAKYPAHEFVELLIIPLIKEKL